MSKENPYFKFYTSEWLNGRITLEEYELQGLFINLCAYYWHSHGDLTKEQANKKFKNPVGLDSLLKENLIGLKGEKIIILFLDEQLIARGVQSVQNRANGNKGGRPKKTHSVNLENQNKSESKPIDNKSNSDIDNNSNIDNTFDTFWDLYDKKVDKGVCEKKWSKIPKSKHEHIFAHVKEYVKSTPDKQIRKNPETYLNREAWENEIIRYSEQKTPLSQTPNDYA